ncbi:MAG: hypothetical protein H7070_15440 [Saprospiraceae bacterium]|nr:hypothetical protein [Pyrinomonadaceae bacterium]
MFIAPSSTITTRSRARKVDRGVIDHGLSLIEPTRASCIAASLGDGKRQLFIRLIIVPAGVVGDEIID